MKTRAVIALGANLGDKEKTISKAQKQIGKLRGVELVANSKKYRSQALTEQGVDPNEPEYVNAVTIIDTSLSPKKLKTVPISLAQRDHIAKQPSSL